MANKSDNASEFEQAASTRRAGLARELWDFLKHNKKWWLLPILLVMLLLGALVFLGSAGSSIAPFIYALF